MLSGESAVGKYPVQCVETMSKIAMAAESDINYNKRLGIRDLDCQYDNYEFYLDKAVCIAAKQLDAKAIFTYTESGDTPKALSGFMPCCPIYAVTKNEKTYRQLALVNNVFPIIIKDECENIREILAKGIEKSKQQGNIVSGDVIAIAGGGTAIDGYESSDMNRTMGGIIKI